MQDSSLWLVVWKTRGGGIYQKSTKGKSVAITPKTPPQAKAGLAALIRAAATFAYDIAAAIKEENGENAKALTMVLNDDPLAEFHVSVRLAPDKCVVVSVVVGGRQFIIHHEDVLDDDGIRH